MARVGRRLKCAMRELRRGGCSSSSIGVSSLATRRRRRQSSCRPGRESKLRRPGQSSSSPSIVGRTDVRAAENEKGEKWGV